MNKNTIIPLIKELERIYDCLAKEFKLKQDRPIITIQSQGRQKNTAGWYWNKKWKHGNKEVGEINICAESLKNHPIETLIHEMVHYSNSCENIQDCNAHQYHNKHFKLKAESYGLNVEKAGRHGWGFTSLSKESKQILQKIKINYKLFELYRKENLTLKSPTKMKKYKCKCTTIRCATRLNAKCLNCNSLFQEE